jgi:NTP pyrophosphatase (non-canonical NTP hydrolase)
MVATMASKQPTMTAERYQREAMRTRGQESDLNTALTIGGLGIAGEAGEVADHIKKVLYHGHEPDTEALTIELGDVLWYMAYLCETLGVSLGDVMHANIDKLRARYPGGFTHEASRTRKAATHG